jgi:hypothetical protein
MSIIGGTQFIERIQFFNGERLFASDLQGLEAFSREMRWLHNQSLHQPGIGSGFAVIGNVGDRQVTISPGYALDSQGREIILTETLVEPIPPVADNGSGGSVFYDLTVSYPQDTDLTPSETRAGICLPTGVVRLREEPVFCWVRLSDDPNNRQPVDATLKQRIKQGLFLVLAQVEIFNCKLKQPVSTAQRRNARPSKQPRIACGIETSPGWLATNIGQSSNPGALGAALDTNEYSAIINTSTGRFQATPFYTARIIGPRIFKFGGDSGSEFPTGGTFFADAIISLPSDAPPQTFQNAFEFTIQIFPITAVLSGVAPAETDIATAVNQWQVGWMGVES